MSRDDNSQQEFEHDQQQEWSETMNEKSAYDLLSRPPKSALKQITGGRLKGMTDVNPQWRYEVMHDVYGPCGEGWKYEIVKTWTEAGDGGQVFQFAHVNVFTRIKDSWSAPIPGIGGSMLIEKDKNGLYHNDEAVKMSVTDALSVALKMLGVAADIYAGRWDGSKYKDIFDVEVYIKKINDAKDSVKLKEVYFEAIKAAENAADDDAKEKIVKAKDVRKAELDEKKLEGAA